MTAATLEQKKNLNYQKVSLTRRRKKSQKVLFSEIQNAKDMPNNLFLLLQPFNVIFLLMTFQFYFWQNYNVDITNLTKLLT